jgi:hypothetical protein
VVVAEVALAQQARLNLPVVAVVLLTTTFWQSLLQLLIRLLLVVAVTVTQPMQVQAVVHHLVAYGQ